MATNTTSTATLYQNAITAAQNLYTAATADFNAPGATVVQQAAARELQQIAQALISYYSAQQGQQSGSTYTVGPTDDVYHIAQSQLGDVTQYQRILQANGLTFTALQTGQQLIMPQKLPTVASQSSSVSS